jgi:cephalosporin hydroxylase
MLGSIARRVRRRVAGAPSGKRGSAKSVVPPSPIAIGPHHGIPGFAPLTADEQAVVDAFHRLYYDQRIEGRRTVYLNWMGWRLVKCPFDAWTYQEIIVDTRPQLIVECGTRFGGGAMFMASLLDLLGEGEVLSIDTDTEPDRPTHPRIRYLAGSSVASETLSEVERTAAGKRTMVVLDSDHSAAHVAKELAVYPRFVSRGCYLIVDDTNMGGHPVWQDDDPGPMAALDAWLPTQDAFEVDVTRERFMLTLNPRGFLRRVR